MTAAIAHLTTVHRADDVRILRKECLSLSRSGYDVTLITSGQPLLEIEHAGIRHVTTGTATHRCSRMLKLQFRTLKQALRLKADLYHFHDPELIPTGIALRLAGRRVIYDVHEDLSRQILTKRWVPRPLRGIVSRFAALAERLAAACCTGIVVVTPNIGRRFPADKTFLVQNYPIQGELIAGDSLPYEQRPWRVSYVGGITAQRGIAQVIDALGLLPESLPARLDLVGQFVPASLEEQMRARPGWNRVDFAGWQPRDRVTHILARARMGLVTYLPAPNHTEAQPNKLFEYMSAGIPVIASHFPLWRDIIESSGCGLVVDPEQPEEIARAMTWIFEHPLEAAEMGARGQAAVQQRFHWDREFEQLLKAYEYCLGPLAATNRSTTDAKNDSRRIERADVDEPSSSRSAA